MGGSKEKRFSLLDLMWLPPYGKEDIVRASSNVLATQFLGDCPPVVQVADRSGMAYGNRQVL